MFGFLKYLAGSGSEEIAQQRALRKAERAAKEEQEAQARIAQLLTRARGQDPDAPGYIPRSKAAIAIVLSGDYAAGAEAWLSIADDFPEARATAYSQVAACKHLMNEFRAALDFYAKAIDAGEPLEHLADSIASVERAMRAAS